MMISIDTILQLLILLVVAAVAHYFTVGRDRRKEFNEAADLLDSRLYVSDTVAAFRATDGEKEAFRRRCGTFRRWRYDRALRRFEQARTTHPSQTHDMYGRPVGEDHAEIIKAAKALKKALARKR